MLRHLIDFIEAAKKLQETLALDDNKEVTIAGFLHTIWEEGYNEGFLDSQRPGQNG